MTSRSPSSRWSREHGFRRGKTDTARGKNGGKKAYRSWWSARLSCWWMNRKHADALQVYSCYWGADYRDEETAEKHWHLGHETRDDIWGY